MSFAYLQLYSRYAPFGGVSEVDGLAEQMLALTAESNQPIAAALTDTFSLVGYPQWRRWLSGSGSTALIGAEVGLNLSGTGRGLPYGLLLLAQSRVGYANLCRLLSAGLQQAGDKPLTAALDLDTLARYQEGLIAIAPYAGGPITAAFLANKAGEAKTRATNLRDLFGPDNFFLAAASPAAQPQPQTIDGHSDDRLVKLNAGLVKLGRELKIGLIGTGEARYAQSDEARSYLGLRSRLLGALRDQYPMSVLQPALTKSQSQDWLYSLQPGRLLTDLQLRSPAELRAHYNESDWPGALANNALVAARCAGWQLVESEPLAILRQRSEEELARRYPDDSQARLALESELADIAELGLSEPLLAASVILKKAPPDQVIIVRRLGGSLIAGLLGLTAQPFTPPTDSEAELPFRFEAYTGGRPLRLEIGQGGRSRLLAGLGGQALPVATGGESGEVPALHPRQVVVSLEGVLEERAVLQPASTEQGLEIGVQGGPLAPDGCARLEIYESSGVGRLQLTLDILNRAGESQLSAAALPLPAVGEYDHQIAGAFDRALVVKQLEWFKLQRPAAYYAAALSLAAPDKLASLSELARLSGITILPPDLRYSEVEFSLTGEEHGAIRTGLGVLLEPEVARQLVQARQTAGFSDLNDFVKRVALNAGQIERLGWAGALDGFGERERLVAAASEIEATSREWQTWRSNQTASQEESSSTSSGDKSPENGSGQLSLFDLFTTEGDAPPTLVPEEPAAIGLPEVAPLSRLERLQQAYRALGFFTSEHPLWGQLMPSGADASRDDPVGLGQLATLATSEGEGRPLLVEGLVIALRRLPIAGPDEAGRGDELTVLQLEDFSGQAELLVPRSTPAEGVELVEGMALSARVRRLKPPAEGQTRLVLVALALAPYPARPGLLDPASDEGLTDPALTAALEAPSSESQAAPAPHDDHGWAESLFANLGMPGGSKPGVASNPGGKAAAAQKPPRIIRRVHIHLPPTESEEAEFELMEQLNRLLRQYPGEDSLVLYLPQPDGSTTRLEPQSLSVAYNQAFAADITGLVGPGGLEFEERSA